MRFASRLPSLGLALAIGCGTASARGAPQDVLGFGARSWALGATGAADAIGYEAVYGNPALLSTARSKGLTLGFASAVFDLHAKIKVSYEPLHGSILGAVLPIPLGGMVRDRVTLGVGFFTPFNLLVRGRILYAERPQFPVADRTQSIAVQAGLGVDLGHGVRVGGGFAALAALSGSVLVATDASGRMSTTVEDTLLAEGGLLLGASMEWGEAWRVGATLRGPLVGRFNVVITVQDLGAITVPPLHIAGVAQYDPLQVAVEFARIQGPWKAALGATYKRWSAFPGFAEPTVRCPEVASTTGQSSSGSCGVLVPAAPEWHDTVVPRAGIEHTLRLAARIAVHGRAGFFFEPSPAPAQTQRSNVYDNARAAFTFGFGVELGPTSSPLRVDLAGQVHALLPRDHVKVIEVLADNPGFPQVTTQGLLGAFGATVGVNF